MSQNNQYYYTVYTKEDGEWKKQGTYNSISEISKNVNLTTHAIHSLINGIFTIYADRYKIIHTAKTPGIKKVDKSKDIYQKPMAMYGNIPIFLSD